MFRVHDMPLPGMLENGQMNSWVKFPRTENRMKHLQLQISKILFHEAVVSRGDAEARMETGGRESGHP